MALASLRSNRELVANALHAIHAEWTVGLDYVYMN